MTEILKISEIFLSIQGEGTRAGRPCTFIRLAGCNLQCNWCDTQYAFQGGEEMSIQEILGRIDELGGNLVEVTGGEPLIQPGALGLLTKLCDRGFETLLETNGSIDISALDSRVNRIVDFKCPSSSQDSRNLWSNTTFLTERDEVKFVIGDRADYNFALKAIGKYELTKKCPVLLACVYDMLAPKELSRWILEDKLEVRLNIQLHKIIFPDIDRGI